MRILYIITTFNPLDNNRAYFKDDGYVYESLVAINEARRTSKHEIDIYFVDFASGPLTRACIQEQIKKRKINAGIVMGPNTSGAIAVNKALQVLNSDYRYDLIWYQASDAILQNTRKLDAAVADMFDNTSCLLMYLKAQPGLALPNMPLQPDWYNFMPLNAAVHYNVFCAKSDLLRFYKNRLYIDFLEGCHEVLYGYYVAACSGWRKISPILDYLHLPRTGVTTDRKHSFSNINRVRGGVWFTQSEFCRRDIVSWLSSDAARRAGIHFRKDIPVENPCIITKTQPLPKSQRYLLAKYVKDKFFLSKEEFDYESIPVTVLKAGSI